MPKTKDIDKNYCQQGCRAPAILKPCWEELIDTIAL